MKNNNEERSSEKTTGLTCECCGKKNQEELYCREIYKFTFAIEWVCSTCYEEQYGIEWNDLPEENINA